MAADESLATKNSDPLSALRGVTPEQLEEWATELDNGEGAECGCVLCAGAAALRGIAEGRRWHSFHVAALVLEGVSEETAARLRAEMPEWFGGLAASELEIGGHALFLRSLAGQPREEDQV